ncbi:hypothetical protein BDN72DRAFT_957397 [Pluteus cervinus]|uniref:Uncharacterized protein n=1 Tax=Pluteus cervinus TaxID=181527 RepID=A0ACD3B606_9AGAR|nr:hypothetical protein BDN72DRAFT_957397 [Pluteus cervinus]
MVFGLFSRKPATQPPAEPTNPDQASTSAEPDTVATQVATQPTTYRESVDITDTASTRFIRTPSPATSTTLGIPATNVGLGKNATFHAYAPFMAFNHDSPASQPPATPSPPPVFPSSVSTSVTGRGRGKGKRQSQSHKHSASVDLEPTSPPAPIPLTLGSSGTDIPTDGQPLVTDPQALHTLISTIPAKILHAYTIANLNPTSSLPSSPPKSGAPVPSYMNIPPTVQLTPMMLTCLTAFFSSVKPPPQLHCVRCHNGYYQIENTDRSCLIPHDDESAEVERVGVNPRGAGGTRKGRAKGGFGTEYETHWACCGQVVEGDGDMGPPDGWCYEGKHTIDPKRARFRADSTPHEDKLVTCQALGCHDPHSSSEGRRKKLRARRSSRASPRKRARPAGDEGDSDEEVEVEEHVKSAEEDGNETTGSGIASSSKAGRRIVKEKRATKRVRTKSDAGDLGVPVSPGKPTSSGSTNSKANSAAPSARSKGKGKAAAKANNVKGKGKETAGAGDTDVEMIDLTTDDEEAYDHDQGHDLDQDRAQEEKEGSVRSGGKRRRTATPKAKFNAAERKKKSSTLGSVSATASNAKSRSTKGKTNPDLPSGDGGSPLRMKTLSRAAASAGVGSGSRTLPTSSTTATAGLGLTAGSTCPPTTPTPKFPTSTSANMTTMASPSGRTSPTLKPFVMVKSREPKEKDAGKTKGLGEVVDGSVEGEMMMVG